MRNTDEMAFINPRPPIFPMEPLQLLEGFNLSSAQMRDITLLKLKYMKKLALMEIELYDEVIKVCENLESRV